MNRHEENLVKERRTIEATKKNLMGATGKIGLVLKAYGVPITDDGNIYYDNNPAESIYEETAEGQPGPLVDINYIPEWEGNSRKIGMMFDGLGRGMHLEIIYMADHNELKVLHKSNMVYSEIGGELHAFVPDEAWEKMIDSLYGSAKKRLKIMKQSQEEVRVKMAEDAKQTFLQRLAKLWGF